MAKLVIRYPIYVPYTRKRHFFHIHHKSVIFWDKIIFSWTPFRYNFLWTPSKDLSPPLPVLNGHSLRIPGGQKKGTQIKYEYFLKFLWWDKSEACSRKPSHISIITKKS